ncbi:isoprenylcysteine carboxyl methyltransferase family protein [Sphingomonas sp. LY160]|uniref:isoprenylcysteine carboxyl methyltransferase family protein n=1 Tax=Sphingomonas sp. LY160 TaxID=3095342 RepID=UPI002ADEBCEF|nr:isoprenylcysteine carboxylmethyltransferase family protein [Sphingomonas sp. LY160]MEA1071678.1 isoprenylcysteine carboxylmethyltransferase family protein [Sphingomonas sp. LY160]
MTELWPHFAILGFVTLQRAVELPIARANTARLLAAGGREVAPGHYPLIVLLHAAWLAALWWWAPGRPISLVLLTLFVLVEIARIWVLRTIGPRWTTRIIVVPGETLVRRGPYRLVNHPNYAVVVAEIALLPLVFGLWQVALLFSLLNAAILWVRIRAENAALGRAI